MYNHFSITTKKSLLFISTILIAAQRFSFFVQTINEAFNNSLLLSSATGIRCQCRQVSNFVTLLNDIVRVLFNLSPYKVVVWMTMTANYRYIFGRLCFVYIYGQVGISVCPLVWERHWKRNFCINMLSVLNEVNDRNPEGSCFCIIVRFLRAVIVGTVSVMYTWKLGMNGFFSFCFMIVSSLSLFYFASSFHWMTNLS